MDPPHGGGPLREEGALPQSFGGPPPSPWAGTQPAGSQAAASAAGGEAAQQPGRGARAGAGVGFKLIEDQR